MSITEKENVVIAFSGLQNKRVSLYFMGNHRSTRMCGILSSVLNFHWRSVLCEAQAVQGYKDLTH